MLLDEHPSLELLFAQLGLDNDDASIDRFIAEHQLPAETFLTEAPFWSPSQVDFLRNRMHADDQWAVYVDELNKLLHHDSQPK